MEGVEAFLDGEWDSLSKLFSCEDSDIQLHFNGGGSDFSGVGVYGTPFMASHEQYCCVSQESSNTSESPAPNAAAAHDYLHHHHLEDSSMNFSASMDAQMMPVFGDEMMEEILQLKAQMCNDNQVPQDSCNEMKPLGKRPRVSKDTQSRKKKKKGGCTEQSSSTCSSESDSNGKAAKASKGPATDAQSLYARKRRERINERLKMLQTLVPNGTKVDISTMLEEAVHYVKFLQLQIKLLSSDDMWMYAPIAYNGMDMGLYQKLNINPDTHN